MTDTYEPTPDEKRIVAWLRDYGTPHDDECRDTGNCDLCTASAAIERGEHRGERA